MGAIYAWGWEWHWAVLLFFGAMGVWLVSFCGAGVFEFFAKRKRERAVNRKRQTEALLPKYPQVLAETDQTLERLRRMEAAEYDRRADEHERLNPGVPYECQSVKEWMYLTGFGDPWLDEEEGEAEDMPLRLQVVRRQSGGEP